MLFLTSRFNLPILLLYHTLIQMSIVLQEINLYLTKTRKHLTFNKKYDTLIYYIYIYYYILYYLSILLLYYYIITYTHVSVRMCAKRLLTYPKHSC